MRAITQPPRTVVAVIACLICSTSAQSPTNAAQEAALTNPVQECTPYYNVAPFSSIVSNFPTVWQIASILPTDTVAQQLFAKISPGIPDIPPKGTPSYDPSVAFGSYSTSDPDCWWTYRQCSTPKFPGLQPDVIQCLEPNTWGLTLDDGPNCSHNAFYEFLRTNNQKATLFYIGSNVLDWPLQAQAGINDGHTVGVHTWSHRAMCALSNEQVFAELYYSTLAIKNVLGVQPTFWRPPYGDVDDRVRYIAAQLGLATYIWNFNTFDYTVATIGQAAVQANYQAIYNNQTAGNFNTAGIIVLTHELNNDTISIFQSNYPQIKQHFQHVEPANVCVNQTHPYVEPQYVYPSHAQYIAGTTTLSSYSASATIVTTLSSLPAQTDTVSTIASRTVQTGSSFSASNGGTVIGQPTGSNGAGGAVTGGGAAAVTGTVLTSSTSKSSATRREAFTITGFRQIFTLVGASLIGAAAVVL